MPDETGRAARHAGVGDRWLAGEALEGVRFAAPDAVEVLIGRREGDAGTILLLVALEPEPAYLVQLGSARVRLAQSALRALP